MEDYKNRAEGFQFLNETDAKLASKEKKQVEYLQQRFHSDKPEEIKAFYEKAIKEHVFKTPIGMEYLKQLQNYLINQGICMADELLPIPINHPCEKLVKPKKRAESEEKNSNAKAWLKASVLINVLLVIAVAVMFIVANTSNHPNVLNYREKLLNEYSSWEQDLTQRENELREKERELEKWNE